MVERDNRTVEARGSIPLTSTPLKPWSRGVTPVRRTSPLTCCTTSAPHSGEKSSASRRDFGSIDHASRSRAVALVWASIGRARAAAPGNDGRETRQPLTEGRRPLTRGGTGSGRRTPCRLARPRRNVLRHTPLAVPLSKKPEPSWTMSHVQNKWTRLGISPASPDVPTARDALAVPDEHQFDTQPEGQPVICGGSIARTAPFPGHPPGGASSSSERAAHRPARRRENSLAEGI